MNTPTPAEIAGAINLLSVLELAKDAEALKAALQEIADAQAALAAQTEELNGLIDGARSAQAEAEAAQAAAAGERANASIEIARVAEGFRQLEEAREAAKVERHERDLQAATVREELAAARAKVDSDSDQVRRREDALKLREDALVVENKRVADAVAAAERVEAEYKAKLEELRKIAG